MNASDFTPTEVLSNIQENDRTFEIIGFVEKIYKIRRFGESEESAVFQFVVSNGSESIKIVAWNDLAHKYEKIITDTKSIVHLEKVLPKKPKNKKFLVGSIPFELIMQKCTTVSISGLYQPSRPTERHEIVEMKDVRIKDGHLVDVKGFIKTPFNIVTTDKGSFYVGSITDGYFKLQIVIVSQDNENCDSEFDRGMKVLISGRVKIPAIGCPHLKVMNMADISKVDNSVMPFLSLINGFHKL